MLVIICRTCPAVGRPRPFLLRAKVAGESRFCVATLLHCPIPVHLIEQRKTCQHRSTAYYAYSQQDYEYSHIYQVPGVEYDAYEACGVGRLL